MDLSKLRLVVYDEADEIFVQPTNHSGIEKLYKHLSEKMNTKPQTVLFSATFDEDVMEVIDRLIGTCTVFKVAKEALKLKGVKMLRISMDEGQKMAFIGEVYSSLGNF